MRRNVDYGGLALVRWGRSWWVDSWAKGGASLTWESAKTWAKALGARLLVIAKEPLALGR